MRSIILKYLIFLQYLFILILPASLVARNDEVIRRFGQERTTSGKEFWIAIPPNESSYKNLRKEELAIYVTSNKKTTASIEYNGQIVSTKTIDSLQITTFSARDRDLNWSWEVYSSERIEKKGIRVFSEDSISVFVLNSKQFSSDGYMALPVRSWGEEYIHVSYYDHYEYDSDVKKYMKRGAGFIVIANEDNTSISVQLKGKGRGYPLALTLGGRRIGDKIENVILNRGEIYTVRGNGRTKGKFDLSGSKIISNKPVGLISFDMRTSLPSNILDGRDLLCEMLPPVSSWGRNYTSIEFKRKGKGDFFRIVAAHDSTNWSVDWYDLDTKKLLGSRSALLAKSGDFYEYNNSISNYNNRNSIKGTAVWKADKPVMVMQYSYSANWDNSINYDPFMVMVVSDEQFVRSAVFQTPSKNGLSNHWLNILVAGDSADVNNSLLKSLTVDGQKLWNSYQSNLLSHRIPGTNMYWAAIGIKPGAHRIQGNTKFGAYIYGYGKLDSYGWPAAMAVDDFEVDTLEPEIIVDNPLCGEYIVRSTEVRNGNLSDFPRQVETGIDSVWLDVSSYNFELIADSTVNLDGIEKVTEYSFKLNIINKSKVAMAVYYVSDKAGNTAVDTIFYPSENLPKIVFSFGNNSDTINIPGQTISLPVYIAGENFRSLEIRNLEFEIVYENKWMKYLDSIVQGDVIINKNWNLTTNIVSINDSISSLNINATSDWMLDTNGRIFDVFFTLLLSPSQIYTPELYVFSDDVADMCIALVGDTALVRIDVCAIDIRQVKLSAEDFSFGRIVPNPVVNSNMEVNFSVGFKANTTIEIFNSYGSKIKTIYNREAEPGKHSLSVQLNDLPSGAYLIKFTSGPYVKTRRFILTK